MNDRKILITGISVLVTGILILPLWADRIKKESILDKRVHIEKKIIRPVPYVQRWCDRLPLKKHRIDVGGARLYVEEEGEGIPLVLINGGPGGTHHYFHPWFSRARSFARVIYYDQRGCGLSDRKPGPEGYSVGQAVEDLEKIRQALKINQWVVLGYSYGGFLAQLYCLTYPENLKGMILLGASPGFSMNSGKSRQYDFITGAEIQRMKEFREELGKLYQAGQLNRKAYIPILIYNSFLNGDWKRQHFYKPSRERLSEIALYEWDHDEGFNGILGGSQSCYDFKGIFDHNPVPTLILEGKWDLTWGPRKAELFKANHPGARMVMFENAAHGIYDEQPEKFFNTLREFILPLPPLQKEAVKDFKSSLKSWEEKVKKAKQAHAFLQKYDWGLAASRRLAKAYQPDWLKRYGERAANLLRIGFAFYDVREFSRALAVFRYLEKTEDRPMYRATGLIWQAHMLDLLRKRAEAVKLYRKVIEMKVESTMQHGQYKFTYRFNTYARKRLTEPFKYLPNTLE